ncbi:MAG: TIGR00270 family protein [Candidatus Micrarchaeota archaeon]|nr:TIGR00270 family protein [Candidatus Micrarchaeota archaeon]
MECEICGKPEAPYLVLIEGARMRTCGNCARMGKILQTPTTARPPMAAGGPHGSGRSLANAAPEWELVDGFGGIMKAARLRMHLPLSVLAERIAEKESFLERIEHESTHPSETVARKIQKELGVTLLEQTSESASGGAVASSSSGGITLGDILEIERRKKKESK